MLKMKMMLLNAQFDSENNDLFDLLTADNKTRNELVSKKNSSFK